MKLEYSLIAVFVLVVLWFVFLESFTLEATNMQLAGFMQPIFDFILDLLKRILDAFIDFLSNLF